MEMSSRICSTGQLLERQEARDRADDVSVALLVRVKIALGSLLN
jgi:hypothetical protein